MSGLASYGRTKAPCRYCPKSEKYLGCHDSCEKFIEFQKAHEEEVARIRKNKYEHYQTFWSYEHKKYAEDNRNKVWKQTKR